jgi:hypothetical protein
VCSKEFFVKQKLSWIALVLFLAMLVPGISALAQEEQGEKDPLVKMMEEGWKPVAPGVLQRSFEDNKVETFAVGSEGMRFVIKQLQGRLAALRKDYQAHPSEDLRRAIASYRKQIARFQKELRTATAESLESAIEKVGCSVSYSSYANATWLTNVAGVTSSSSANFNTTCGYSAEVWAEARAQATKNGVFDDFLQQDGPRYGAVISASATATIQGDTNCQSSSYSYARLSSENIFLTFSALNSGQCPIPPDPPVPTISGPTFEFFTTVGCRTRTWTVAVAGGVSPYTYQWYFNGTAVGTASSYSRSVCPGNDPGFDLSVTVAASASRSGSDTHHVSVTYNQQQTCYEGGRQVLCNNSLK